MIRGKVKPLSVAVDDYQRTTKIQYLRNVTKEICFHFFILKLFFGIDLARYILNRTYERIVDTILIRNIMNRQLLMDGQQLRYDLGHTIRSAQDGFNVQVNGFKGYPQVNHFALDLSIPFIQHANEGYITFRRVRIAARNPMLTDAPRLYLHVIYSVHNAYLHVEDEGTLLGLFNDIRMSMDLLKKKNKSPISSCSCVRCVHESIYGS